MFRVISHQSHVPAFKFRKNEIIVKGHEAPVILHVLQVKIQFQSADRLRESIGVLLWAVLIILPILSHCRFTCHLKIGLFPFQEFFTFMYILLMKEWTIVSNGFIMYMIWLVFETFEQTQPNKNWKENEK